MCALLAIKHIWTYHMIAKPLQTIHTLLVATVFRRAEVSRNEAKNLGQSHLIEHNLVVDLIIRQAGPILAAPSPATDLMSPVVHALDDIREGSRVTVHHASAIAVSGNEECCFRIFLVQVLEQSLCPGSWAAIKSERHHAWLSTVLDLDSVGNLSKLGTGDISGIISGRRLVCVASSTVAELAGGGCTIVGADAAETLPCLSEIFFRMQQ